MAHPAKRNATYDDLMAVPPHLTAEIIFGDLVTHPKPAPPHSNAQFSIGGELSGPFQKGRGGPGGWWFMTEPELRLGPHVLAPDIAGWQKSRLPHLPSTKHVSLAPDWVCEIVSPSTERIDRGPKRRIYATYGVSHLWHLNPVAKFVEDYMLRNGEWIHVETFDGVGDQHLPPFDAIAIQLNDLWPIPEAPNLEETK
jgi:Uma2 family endonuclease